DTLDELLRRRLVQVLGKGGVGRTSVAAAIAIAAAKRGRRTLVIETDPRTPIAAQHGLRASFQTAPAAPNLWLMLLDRQASLEEYLGFVVARPLLRAVFASALYQYFVHAAPALRELMMMGKIYHEVERRGAPPWDLVVADLPASGQALGMIGTPLAARETFGGNLVGREAAEVARLFRDANKCAMILVTTAEPLALTETLEIHRQLAAWQITTGAIVFNRMTAAAFTGVDIARMMERGSRERTLKHLEDLAAIARAELQRRTRQRRALGILKRQIGAPIVQLEEACLLGPETLTEHLANRLDRRTAPTGERGAES
ncbi:MAG: ArsA family ATPase, partial [Candidatus Binataceae bacterium]